MSHLALTTEAKAAIKANLELELKARKEKLAAMCEAQVASLRSRLERRVNRIPATKRNMRLIDLLDAAIPSAARSPAKKEAVPPPVPAATRVNTATTTTAAARKTRAVPAKSAPKPAPKPAPKSTRGKKRPSDDGDKENEELNVPKKRVKAAVPAKPTAPTATATTRSTRAASRKVPPQVLSPKPNNHARAAPRTRRQR